MDDSNQQKDKEVFNVGSLAVVNADAQPAEAKPANNFNKLGALALSRADLQVLEPGEHLVTVVQRHPIGLVGIYTEMLTGIVGVMVLAIVGMFVLSTHLSGAAKGLIAAGGVLVVGFMIALLLISSYVYRRSKLLVTDKSVVQILQHALFNRKISRLSMSNVEDVNVEQKGLLQSLFNYGTLTIQTAGSEDNFVFTMCPTPDKHAERILEARQSYVRSYPGGE